MWRHLPGSSNSADLASRGCTAEQIIQRRWWEGPIWLYDKEENWPKSEENPNEELVNSELRKTVLSVDELCKAEISLMLLIQKDGFKYVYDNKLKQLRPFVDQNGVIRAKTNLDYRDDTSDFIHPIILPNNRPVVKLLILSYHVDYLHADISLLMSHLREKYWVLKSRKTIRNCIKHCVKCQRLKVKRCEVMPGILPSDRVNDAAVFEIVGVDQTPPKK
ncbi:uncharacterized protein [Parasteatoda tepidariorum]|uniref:uncharacterized protein n=1 Tax=Parasteatoda tepidariorum TaxID=114398 RepID=UPI0039BD7E78